MQKIFKKSFFRSHLIFFLLPVIVLYYPLIKKFPIKLEETNKSITYLKKDLQEDDKIYIYYKTIPAFNYFRLKEPDSIYNEIILGENHSDDRNNYKEGILKLKGNMWLLFSHVLPFNDPENDEKYIITTLQKNGFTIEKAMKYHGSNVYKIIDERSLPVDNETEILENSN